MFMTYRAITYSLKALIIIYIFLHGGVNGFRFCPGIFLVRFGGKGGLLFRFRAYLRFYAFYVGRSPPA